MKNIIIIFIVVGYLSLAMNIFAQPEYKPKTEHQYEIEILNDSLIPIIVNNYLQLNDKMHYINSIAAFHFTLENNGEIINLEFENLMDFPLEDKILNSIIKKLKSELKFRISENAKNYYLILNRPIKISYIITSNHLIK